ncbi:MAG: DNA internalization-related competence protein ComEC/Rec2 [Bacillota bacterium]
MTARPGLWAGLGTCGGTALAFALADRRWALLWATLCALGGMVALGLGLRIRARTARWLALGTLFAALALARTAGSPALTPSALESLGAQEGMTVTLDGVVAEPPRLDGDRLQLLVRGAGVRLGAAKGELDGERVLVRVRLAHPGDRRAAEGLGRGDRVRIAGVLERPSPPRNPGAFDYRRYLERQGIRWIVRVSGLAAVDVDPGRRFSPLRWADDAQRRLSAVLDDTLSPQTAGFLQALVLGDQRALDPEAMEMLTRLGLRHAVAISGLHVSLVVALFLLFLRGVGVTRERAVIGLLVFVPAYVALTGMSPSAVRAGLMAELALFLVAFRRLTDALNAWGWALAVSLLCVPAWLFSPGFQLSYAVTWGLLVAALPLAEHMPKVPAPLRAPVAVTLVAHVVSFPLVVGHFHNTHGLTLVANLLLVPVVSLLLLPLGTVVLLLALVHPALAFVPARLADGAVALFFTLAAVLDRPLLYTGWPPPPAWWWPLYGLALGVWVYGLTRWEHRRVWMVFGAVGVLLLVSRWVGGDGAAVRVTFLDVGQGDAAVVEADGKVFLIDGGGQPAIPAEAWRRRRDPFDPGADVVVPYLLYRGVRRIDTVFVSHGDEDHLGGLFAVVQQLRVKEVAVGPGFGRNAREQAFLELCTRQGVSVRRVVAGFTRQVVPGVYWRVVHPTRAGCPGCTENDASLVLALHAYRRVVLFTGDVEQRSERAMVADRRVGDVDVLKVAHHGSKTSTSEAWLSVVRPEWAVVSVGEQNRYGHPHPAVVERLGRHGARVLRTDRHGAIEVFIRPDGGLRVVPTLPSPSEAGAGTPWGAGDANATCGGSGTSTVWRGGRARG